ncbi:MAG: peroxiredoxin [Brevundimonas sp.]|uniref:peroxiredoxin n=1 Tax=Brevundimonas sp. TaxID=1871086 RepID=UPI002488142B|nr:peroxiredoxin [Brevundimonas sp.]MDI1326944.1 peroxiredoxin [Brevundimonas sp.]
MEITEGLPAPAFDMAADGGGRASLAALKGQTVVLFFYPKADTPACTTESQDFSALIDDFAGAGAVVIGVSRDPVKKLDRFKAKHDLKVILASDEPEDVTNAWGVWVQKKLYGREYMGIERATFLIDGDGVVRRVWRKVSVKGHAAEVLATVKSL